MSRLRVAVVDDEALARARLRRLLAAHDDVELVGEFASGADLLEAWRDAPADLVLLDIRMPGPDGLDVATRLQPAPLVVFVTAHAGHAVDAFGVDALDYLMKPVEAERLDASLQRVRARRRDAAPAAADVAAPRRLALPLGRRTHLVAVDSIDCVVAQANYVEIHAAGRRYLLRRPLHAIEADFDDAHFVRVHRSVLVRIAAVRQIESADSGRYRLHLAGGANVRSGRRYAGVVRERFGLGGAASADRSRTST